MRTEMQRVRMRHTAAAPSCLAAVYFHTVGSIPRVTKKSLIDGFQLSTRFWLFLSRVRSRGHWQSVSFEFPCDWAPSQADIAAPVLLTLQPAAHAFKAVQKKSLPWQRKEDSQGLDRCGTTWWYPILKQEAILNVDCWDKTCSAVIFIGFVTTKTTMETFYKRLMQFNCLCSSVVCWYSP